MGVQVMAWHRLQLRVPVWCLAVLCALAAPGVLAAQTVTGSIVGTVVDQTDQVLPGALVMLTDERTGAGRETTTSGAGEFVFTSVQPGTYTVRVELDGFNPFERRNTVLPAGESLSVGTIALSVGGLTETVTTTAQGTPVQTQSSERSAMITSRQLELVAARGRDVVSLFRLLPGVSYQQDPDALGGGFGTTTPNIGGNRNTMIAMNVDGQLGNDLGSPQVFSSTTIFDAISEVNLQLNNYRAEHGHSGGAAVNIVTKSGTREYRGTGYWFRRHEGLNANSFFNNRNQVEKPLYRYSTLGGTLGGPVPGATDRLFFFYALEHHDTMTPQPLRTVTVPTAAERRGDFSDSREADGSPIVIHDPLTGEPFPGNRIPENRINPSGRALLDVFPLPNQLDRTVTQGQYNYTFQESLDVPKRQHMLRVDYRPSARDQFYVRGKTWWSDSRGYSVPAGTSNWGLIGLHYTFTDDALIGNWTRIVSPTVVNELSAGWRRSTEAGPPLDEAELASRTRSAIGFAAGQFNPQINALDLLPQASFGGVPGSPASIAYNGRTILTGRDLLYSVNNTLTWTRGSHALKAGFYAEIVRNEEGADGIFAGTFNFGRDVNNPSDAGYAYANALLGNFTQYTESTSKPPSDGRGKLLAWFVQDTWRATPRLTVDYGVRFGWYTPYAQSDGTAAAFAIERYDPGLAPRLYQPVLVDDVRMGHDPVTGEIVPAVYIGAFVPGTGDPANGMVVETDPDYPSGFREQAPILVEPRLGVSWDPTGDGRTAVRASFGLFHQPRSTGNFNWQAVRNPPFQFNPRVFYGNLDTLLDSSAVMFPSDVQSFDREIQTPRFYSFTAGVQRDIGWSTVVDVAYVGTRGRRLLSAQNINTVPYGARFLPEHQDPTTGRPLPDDFFRPFPGYGGITYRSNIGISDYHSLQVQANRRFADRAQFGVAYTLSRTKDYGSSDTEGLPLYQDLDAWRYDLASFDQTHVLTVNYTWDLPQASAVWNNRLVAALLDNWQVSGVAAFASGTPAGIGLQTTDGFDFTGGGDGTRVVATGDPTLPKGQRSLDRWFDTSMFQRPAPGEIGNAGRQVIRLPGTHVWDLTLFKNIPIGGHRYLQFRWEAYNVFNHTQFSGVDTTARFDPEGNQTNANFGRVTSTRAPRTMQASIRVVF